MSMTPEELQALNARRGYTPPAAPAEPTAPLYVGGPPPEQGGGGTTDGTVYSQVETEVGRVKNPDGTFTVTYRGSTDPNASTYTRIEGTPTPVDTTPVDTTPVDPVPGGTRADARNTIRAVLATYGLGELSDYLYGVYARGEVNINNPDAIIFSIREQDAYKKRFAANAARAKKGLAELDPASYLQLENQYRQLLQSNGLPAGFYDQTEDFTSLLEGDVSPQELQTRVQQGFRAVQDADPEVKRQMQELYGVNEAGLAAYFLDPTKAAPILTRQAEAAKIAARAKEQGRLQLGFATAEEIAARGITAQEAEAGFTALGLQEGLYTEMMGEQALTQQQKVGAALGYDVEAQRKLAERRGTRKAAFQGGGSFAKTTGQTSGTVQTGLGVAE
jgi:hypothetical protein